jgi:hypothetical protein
MLDFEVLEDVGVVAVEDRGIQQIEASDPLVEDLEIAPDADEDDLLSPIDVRLPSYLRMDEAIVPACVVKGVPGLLSEGGDLPGTDTATEDANDQVPTPARKLKPPRLIVLNAGPFGNNRAISAAL